MRVMLKRNSDEVWPASQRSWQGGGREVKKAHPDAGGTAEMFASLVKARDRLLAALGASAPQPKPPQYAAKGVQVRYRPFLSGQFTHGSLDYRWS